MAKGCVVFRLLVIERGSMAWGHCLLSYLMAGSGYFKDSEAFGRSIHDAWNDGRLLYGNGQWLWAQHNDSAL